MMGAPILCCVGVLTSFYSGEARKGSVAMNNYVLVKNDGILDLNSLVLMGASTKKDDDSKIGQFGTGFKYAIAEATRMGIGIIITNGDKIVKVETRQVQLRDKVFSKIVYNVNNTEIIESALTTELGSHDWNDPWFILREIISNAKDEPGMSVSETDNLDMEPNEVHVYIEMTPEITSIMSQLNQFFKHEHEKLSSNESGAIFTPVDNKVRIFKKSVFIKTLDKKGLWDYELSNLRLNESRSADVYDVHREIGYTVDRLDISYKRQVLRMLSANNEASYVETEITPCWQFTHSRFAEWKEAFIQEFPNTYLCARVNILASRLVTMNKSFVQMPAEWDKFLRQIGVPCECDVLGEVSKKGATEIPMDTYHIKMFKKSKKILSKFISPEILDTPITVFTGDIKTPNGHKVSGFTDKDKDGKYFVAIHDDVVKEKGLRETVKTHLHELIHVISKAEDSTREFENAQDDIMCKILFINGNIVA